MRKLFALLLLSVSIHANCQDRLFARKMVDTLTSKYFWGRGYTNNGMQKAAAFIAGQLKMFGLKPVKAGSYFQPFSFPVNTFPGKMEVVVNNKKLVPGKDFIVSPNSTGIQTSAILHQKDSTHFVNEEKRITVSIKDKLTWSVAAEPSGHTDILLDKKAVQDMPATIKVDVENKEIDKFGTANVCGWVRGTRNPDSIIVLSAHYDHLGGMGADTYFPGANDNASGTSLLLGLAKCYAVHPQPYTIAFIFFAGEEAGLRGSKYFTGNPLFPLNNIRFVLNLDLEGTGDEGITVVNATEFPKQFAILNAVNDSAKYLVKIN
ncbi:MAG TPA: M28 family peptidase, partial [Segetibacter sp.]|nr:M28 family peptidase [Segetibacter sp.]